MSEDDPVLTEQTRRELVDVIALADETDRWLREHPQRTPFASGEQRKRSVPHRDCWIAAAEALLHLRHAWGHARNLIASDVDRNLIASDGRWALSGLRATEDVRGTGRPFTPFVLAHGWRGQQPLDAEHEQQCYAWYDSYRTLDANGSARPAIVVCHCRDPEPVEQLARGYDLVAEYLPWSWFRPSDHCAVAVSTAGVPPIARRAASPAT